MGSTTKLVTLTAYASTSNNGNIGAGNSGGLGGTAG